jgi:hypothetical protein
LEIFYGISREVTPLATKLDEDGEGGVLPLDQLLPMAKMSPFHCFFINFCINNETGRKKTSYLNFPTETLTGWGKSWGFL